MIAGIRHSGRGAHGSSATTTSPTSSELLAGADPATPKIVAFEIVYSMDGDISPIGEICDVAQRYGALDLSRRGPCGRHVRRARRAASPSATACSTRSTSSQGTLAKAFGVVGGYIASTPPPSTSCAPAARASSSPPRCRPRSRPAALASVRHVSGPSRAARAPPGARRTPEAPAGAAGLPVMPNRPRHIVPVFGGRRRALQAGQRPAAGPARHLRPADQLSDRAARHRAAAASRRRRCMATTDMARLVAALQRRLADAGPRPAGRRRVAIRPSASSRCARRSAPRRSARPSPAPAGAWRA